jgi:hypothetical protein
MKSILPFATTAVILCACQCGHGEEVVDQRLRFWLVVTGEDARFTATEPDGSRDKPETRVFRVECGELRAAPSKDRNLTWALTGNVQVTQYQEDKTCQITAPRIVIAHDPTMEKGMMIAFEGDDQHPVRVSGADTVLETKRMVLYPGGMIMRPGLKR